MKLVTRAPDEAYLHSLRERLEESGIPARVMGSEVARMIPPFAATQAGLWIYLDHQLKDAVELVEDPGHKVCTGVDVAAFYASQPTVSEQSSRLNQALLHIGLVMTGVIVSFFLAAWVLSQL